MKQLTCEMCGSTDLIKDGGVFVCQTCGTKYSVEEAKRMMIEGTVDVQGTVKVDNSAFVEKYLANARRAKEKEDWEETEKYYNMVEQNDPDNIEAIFYSAYGKAKQTLTDGDIYKRQAAFKVLKNCISVIDDHYKPERRVENKEAISAMAVDLGKMITSNFVFTEWKNGYGIVTKTNKGETYQLFASLLDGFKESVDNIQKIDDQAYLHESLITLFTIAKIVDWSASASMNKLMDEWISEEKAELEAIRKKTIDAYWAEHTDEKMALDAEKKTLVEKVENLNSEIASLPELKAEAQIQAEIESLRQKLKAWTIYDGRKKRKALQEQLDDLTGEVENAKASREAAVSPIQAQIDAANARIAEIDKELTNVL